MGRSELLVEDGKESQVRVDSAQPKATPDEVAGQRDADGRGRISFCCGKYRFIASALEPAGARHLSGRGASVLDLDVGASEPSARRRSPALWSYVPRGPTADPVGFGGLRDQPRTAARRLDH
jgi:hypothetical protein